MSFLVITKDLFGNRGFPSVSQVDRVAALGTSCPCLQTHLVTTGLAVITALATLCAEESPLL